MIHMLCRNKVLNFDKWKTIFDSHANSQYEAGLHLLNLWTETDDANNVFFLFQVDSIEKAHAFINAPHAAEAGKESSVVDGEIHFLDSN